MQGMTFVNQYIIVGTLGQGAFGKVKLVLNTEDMNLYAVKLLSKGSLLRHQRMRTRTASDFQAEAQRRLTIIRLLHHPNIICPFEIIGQQHSLLQGHVCRVICWLHVAQPVINCDSGCPAAQSLCTANIAHNYLSSFP